MADTNPNGAIRVAILDRQQEGYQPLQGLGTPRGAIELVGFLEPGDNLLGQLDELCPDILFLDGDDPEVDAIGRTEEVTIANRPVSCVLLWSKEDTGQIRHAMRAGAEDFLIKPPGVDQFRSVCVDAFEIIRERFPAGWGAQAEPAEGHYCQVTGFVCGKSGVGKTTLATNLAVLFASEVGRRTAVIDLQPGYSGVLLNLQPTQTLAELVGFGDDLDAQVLSPMAHAHDSGLKLYTWCQQPDFRTPYHVPAPLLESILRTLAADYDQLVVIYPRLAGDEALRALSIMDEVVCVTTGSDLLTLRDTKIFLDTIEDGYVDKDRTKIVLNRHERNVGFSREDVEKTLRREIMFTVPNDYSVTSTSINLGVPFVTHKPSAQITHTLRAVAAELAGVEAPAEQESRQVFSLFGRR